MRVQRGKRGKLRGRSGSGSRALVAFYGRVVVVKGRNRGNFRGLPRVLGNGSGRRQGVGGEGESVEGGAVGVMEDGKW